MKSNMDDAAMYFKSILKSHYLIKDWSQFCFRFIRGIHKGVYHIFEFISNEPNKKLWSILID
jgi:hypothetical protein